jgi:hypothetical protein
MLRLTLQDSIKELTEKLPSEGAYIGFGDGRSVTGYEVSYMPSSANIDSARFQPAENVTQHAPIRSRPRMVNISPASLANAM